MDYGVANGEESLVKVERLGRKIHNSLFAISDKDTEKYGNLLQIMRDVLISTQGAFLLLSSTIILEMFIGTAYIQNGLKKQGLNIR